MKKIVAIVLAMVMVMGLATVAFAADPARYDVYAADVTMYGKIAAGAGAVASNTDMTTGAAVEYENGTGAIAYVELAGVYYAKIDAAKATVEDFAVTEAGEDVVLFYVTKLGTDVGCTQYGAKATAFDKFSAIEKCGYVTMNPATAAADDWFQTKDGVVHKAAAASAAGETENYLVDGVVVSSAATVNTKDHSFQANGFALDAKTNTLYPTSAICECASCLMTTTAIYKDGKAPATYKVYDLKVDGQSSAWCVAMNVNAPVVSAPVAGETVESAKTFDAGIAMYVGMSVMAAAGSAVVLKKKD